MATFVVTSHLVPIQKPASITVSTPQLSFSSSFTVKYLVHYCGFPQQSAIETSKKLDLLKPSKMRRFNSILNLLKSYGFERAHIEELIRKREIFEYDCDRILRPKMESLVEMGFSCPDLHDMITRNPRILGSGMDSKIKPSFEYLRDSLGSHERARAALVACPWLLTHNQSVWKPNIDLLVREGVNVDALVNHIGPNRIAIMRNGDDMVRAVEFVKKLGIDPGLPKFVNAVLAVANYPLWVKKVEVLKSFGLSEDEILSKLRRDPRCFKYSEEKLRSSLEFFVHTMKLSPSTISSYTYMLGFNIDKRVRPRYNVLELCLSKKLLGEGDAKLVEALHKTEKRFLEDYVYKHLDQIPNLLEVYRAKRTTKKMPNLERLATLIKSRASSVVSTSRLPSPSSSFTVEHDFSKHKLEDSSVYKSEDFSEYKSDDCEEYKSEDFSEYKSDNSSEYKSEDDLVNSRGLQLQSAIAATPQLDQKLNNTNIHRSDSVLNLLKSYGLDATHVAEIIRKRPRVLHVFNCDKNLRPKMEYLVEIGFSGSILGDLIARNPDILMFGLNSQIKPNFESLIGSLGSSERAKAALMACPLLLTKNDWTPYVNLLIREAVAVDNLVGHIVGRKLDILQKADGIGHAVDFVKNLGIDLASPKFVNAVLVVANSPMWEKKVRLFASFGFTKEDVLSLLRRHPRRFQYSEERLRSSFEYLVNTMKLNPKTIGSRPDLLGYSIDKRLRPRYNVVKLLLSKRLLGEGDAKLVSALDKTEEVFLKEYVYKHLQQVPSLLEAYKGEIITNETT